MFRKNRVLLLISVSLLFTSSILLYSLIPKPQPIHLTTPLATEFRFVITKMYQLQWDLVCQPDMDVNGLDEVLADTPDYRPSGEELSKIENIYGSSALKQAGYLTYQKALYLSRHSPNPSTPEPGINPTAPPTYYCPEMPNKINVVITAVSLGKDNRAIVRYEYVRGIREAIIRKIDNHWVITSIKLIEWWGG